MEAGEARLTQVTAPVSQPVAYAPARPSVLPAGYVNLDRGATIAMIGGLVAAVGFFLPLMKINPAGYGSLGSLAGLGSSYGSYGSSYASAGVDVSMATASNFLAVMWLTPILMVLAALVRFARTADVRRRILFAGFQMAAGFSAVVTVLAYASMSSYFTVLAPVMSLQIGAYAMTLGQLAVFIGGLVSMLDLTKTIPAGR